MALFGKTLKLYEKKQNETITVVTSPREHLHIANCTDCTFTIASPVCKCAIERCNGVKVTFQERLTSGQMEIMFSNNVTVMAGNEVKTHIIAIENTSGVNIHIYEPKNMDIIHTNGVTDVTVHIESPQNSQKLEHPVGEDGEFMTRCSKDGEIFTEKVVRVGGGYLTTEREKEVADKKAELFEKKITEFVSSMIKTSNPSTSGKGDNPSTNSASEEGKTEEPPTEGPTDQAPSKCQD